jgi:hypothetical protein
MRKIARKSAMQRQPLHIAEHHGAKRSTWSIGQVRGVPCLHPAKAAINNALQSKGLLIKQSLTMKAPWRQVLNQESVFPDIFDLLSLC